MSSFKEKIKTLKYALVVTKEYNAKLAFLSLFKCVFTAVGPLIPTYYIAKMLDELSGGKNVKQIIIYAVSMVVLCSLVHYFSSRLNMIMSAIYDKIYFQESEIFMKKIVSLDYELLENKEFQDNVKAYKNAMFNNGSVCVRIWYMVSSVLSGFLGIGLSIYMIREPIVQCLKIDNSSFLTSVWPLVLLVVSAGAIGTVMAVMGSKMQKANLKFRLR